MPKTDHLCLVYTQKKLNPQAKRPPRSSMIYGDDQGSSVAAQQPRNQTLEPHGRPFPSRFQLRGPMDLMIPCPHLFNHALASVRQRRHLNR